MVDCCSPCGPIVDWLDKWESGLYGDFESNAVPVGLRERKGIFADTLHFWWIVSSPMNLTTFINERWWIVYKCSGVSQLWFSGAWVLMVSIQAVTNEGWIDIRYQGKALNYLVLYNGRQATLRVPTASVLHKDEKLSWQKEHQRSLLALITAKPHTLILSFFLLMLEHSIEVVWF